VRSKRLLPAIGMVLLLVVALVISACGSDSDSSSSGSDGTAESGKSVEVDVGTDQPIAVDTEKPEVAYLWTSGNLFVEANKEGAEDEAAKRGIDLTIFDAKFDPLRQVEQVQNVLQQGKFDAVIAIPLDYTTLCPILTKQAPSEGVVVVTNDITMCGRVTDEGPEATPPGVLAHAGFPAATDTNRDFFREVAKNRGPGKHVGALFVGPEGNSSSEGTVKGLEEVQDEIKDQLEVPYVIYTDFTSPDALAKTQTLLQAHPEIDTLMTNYSDETIGVVKAVEEAGAEDTVKVYDQGGSSPVVKLIEEGKVEFTTVFHPYQYGADAVTAIADAFEGKKVPRYFGGYPTNNPDDQLGHRMIITKENVDEYEAEY